MTRTGVLRYHSSRTRVASTGKKKQRLLPSRLRRRGLGTIVGAGVGRGQDGLLLRRCHVLERSDASEAPLHVDQGLTDVGLRCDHGRFGGSVLGGVVDLVCRRQERVCHVLDGPPREHLSGGAAGDEPLVALVVLKEHGEEPQQGHGDGEGLLVIPTVGFQPLRSRLGDAQLAQEHGEELVLVVHSLDERVPRPEGGGELGLDLLGAGVEGHDVVGQDGGHDLPGLGELLRDIFTDADRQLVKHFDEAKRVEKVARIEAVLARRA
ncbi:hypothetical protein [Cyprinid herpesvirus 3]|uniref:Uncharacterized protein n=1 Tax=Cyprinid herpesvirus 3 TaxID=180230 RepID=A4FTJ0_CYHV3|nr:hypothetical protein [Cyprinid herpesvirus 3]